MISPSTQMVEGWNNVEVVSVFGDHVLAYMDCDRD